MTDKPKYNPSVSFFSTKNGNGYRLYVDAAVYDILQQATPGKSLYLSEVGEAMKAQSRAKGVDEKNIPQYRLAILPEQDKQGFTKTKATATRHAAARKVQREDDV